MSGSEEIFCRIHMLSDGANVYELAETLRPISPERLVNNDDSIKYIDFQTSGISQTLNQCVTILDWEINIVQTGGDRLPMAIGVTPIRGLNSKSAEESSCHGAVIILRDLREIKLLEEKVCRTEKLAALGKLSAAVAHEIRNPLSSIRGVAKFLSHALKNRPKDQEYADVMVKEVDRINRVVTDLLNFASPLVLVLHGNACC